MYNVQVQVHIHMYMYIIYACTCTCTLYVHALLYAMCTCTCMYYMYMYMYVQQSDRCLYLRLERAQTHNKSEGKTVTHIHSIVHCTLYTCTCTFAVQLTGNFTKIRMLHMCTSCVGCVLLLQHMSTMQLYIQYMYMYMYVRVCVLAMVVVHGITTMCCRSA